MLVESFRILLHRAVEMGISLKKHVELIIEAAAQSEEDKLLILLSQDTEDSITGKEKADFRASIKKLQKS